MSDLGRTPGDERGIVRWHDVELMARVAIAAERREDGVVAAGVILLPGVLDRVVEIKKAEEEPQDAT